MLSGGTDWLTAAELAELGLPGLPTTKRKLNERAARDGWAWRTGTDGAPLARKRTARGGGVEYHVSVLPPAARAALAGRHQGQVAEPANDDGDAQRRWQAFERLSEKARAEAHRRVQIVAAVDSYVAAGLTRTAAVATVAARWSIGAATLWEWLTKIDGVAPSDRLAWLAPQRKGGGAEAPVDEALWQLIISDYLRAEKPTFTSCYRRVQRVAVTMGASLPCERTLRRKVERELDRRIVVSRRDGAEALRRTLPPQKRSVVDLHALELVNIDGHRWDVFVRWPDGTIGRPVMVGIQDVYSRKFLAWSIGRTESAVETRLAFAQLFERYGIPKACLMDNGRAFASKWITGGAASRFRFKIRDEEPLGILTALGIAIHWATPYRGQSKPIERTFRDFCDAIAKDPAFSGAYTGNRPDAKPENYASHAVPIETFRAIVEAGFAEHNARPGRRTEIGQGLKSLDDVFAESYARAPIGKATAEQLRLALLAADNRPTDRQSGAITLHGNRYWSEQLGAIAGRPVTVRFNPDDLHAPIHVYDRDGRYLCAAPVIHATGFLDAAAAGERKRQERDVRKKVRAAEDAAGLLHAARIADAYRAREADAPMPEPGVIRPVRHRGHVAAAIKLVPETAPSTLSDPSQGAVLDRMMRGARALRVIE